MSSASGQDTAPAKLPRNAIDATTVRRSQRPAAPSATRNLPRTVTYRRVEGSPTKSATDRRGGIGCDVLGWNRSPADARDAGAAGRRKVRRPAMGAVVITVVIGGPAP